MRNNAEGSFATPDEIAAWEQHMDALQLLTMPDLPADRRGERCPTSDDIDRHWED